MRAHAVVAALPLLLQQRACVPRPPYALYMDRGKFLRKVVKLRGESSLLMQVEKLNRIIRLSRQPKYVSREARLRLHSIQLSLGILYGNEE